MQRILIFVHDLYEDLELWYPKFRLEEEGYTTTIAGLDGCVSYKGKNGYPCISQISVKEVDEEKFTALLIPGGFAPDKLRRDTKVLSLTKAFFDKKKLVAFICHGGWIPISAKILKGKKVTGTLAIKDDLENAGALFKDEPVVIDGNLISSRTPIDLPYFAKAVVDFLKKKEK